MRRANQIMKMKNLVLASILLLVVTGCSLAQPIVFPTKPWSATVKVIGEDGQSVSNANVAVGYFLPPYSFSDDPEYNARIVGITDTNGLFFATHKDRTGEIGFSVSKQGYYETRSSCTLRDPMENANDRNISLILVLKKVGKPIPMYAKRQEMKIQKEDEPLGFDLEVGDWVTPNGKGEHTDLFFTVHRKIISEREYDCTLTVTFPNKDDGLAVAPAEPDNGSEFKTSRTAAESGYQPELTLHYSFNKWPTSVFGYFIRVRTVLDADGKVKSALYGKIPGNFMILAGTKAPKAGMVFTYYLNPTANDHNLEFNPKQNLFRTLTIMEEVKWP